tara:strand:- start:53406 stop:54482 length:1077 start_codon:yes stop_codon:yes gene_type:complete
MKKIIVIAEAGVNHNGNKDLAYDLIDAAAEAKADYVKFQTYKTSEIIDKKAAKAGYQKVTTDANEGQYEMLKRLELPYDFHKELLEHALNRGINFLSTPFELTSLNFLVNVIGLKINKIPSGEITNAPFLLEHTKTNNDLILSTGMSTLEEIRLALSIIAFGFINKNKKPGAKAFLEAYESEEGQIALKKKVTLLHCTSEYPAPKENLNLFAMDEIKKEFNLKVGYSDHSEGINASIIAAAMGACLIEKHFTMDKSLEGPDHRASIDPKELSQLVEGIRDVEKMQGNKIKRPTDVEIKNKEAIRKSIVANGNIKIGDTFTLENLVIKRPGNGMNPIKIWDLLGKQSKKSYNNDEQISE